MQRLADPGVAGRCVFVKVTMPRRNTSWCFWTARLWVSHVQSEHRLHLNGRMAAEIKAGRDCLSELLLQQHDAPGCTSTPFHFRLWIKRLSRLGSVAYIAGTLMVVTSWLRLWLWLGALKMEVGTAQRQGSMAVPTEDGGESSDVS
jgi:hypothetical protein